MYPNVNGFGKSKRFLSSECEFRISKLLYKLIQQRLDKELTLFRKNAIIQMTDIFQ